MLNNVSNLEIESGNQLNLDFLDDRTKRDGDFIDQIRLMVTRIHKPGEFPCRLGIVSALSGEGVTSVALGVGVVLADDFQSNVCVVDLNWYSSSPLSSSDSPPVRGVSDIIDNEFTLDQALRPTGLPNLLILPAGRLARYKRPKISRSDALVNLLNDLENRFDHLILDIPAILSTSDSVHLASLTDACCLVTHQGVTAQEDVKNAYNEIDHLPVLGLILNRIHYHTPEFLIRLLTP